MSRQSSVLKAITTLKNHSKSQLKNMNLKNMGYKWNLITESSIQNELVKERTSFGHLGTKINTKYSFPKELAHTANPVDLNLKMMLINLQKERRTHTFGASVTCVSEHTATEFDSNLPKSQGNDSTTGTYYKINCTVPLVKEYVDIWKTLPNTTKQLANHHAEDVTRGSIFTPRGGNHDDLLDKLYSDELYSSYNGNPIKGILNSKIQVEFRDYQVLAKTDIFGKPTKEIKQEMIDDVAKTLLDTMLKLGDNVFDEERLLKYDKFKAAALEQAKVIVKVYLQTRTQSRNSKNTWSSQMPSAFRPVLEDSKNARQLFVSKTRAYLVYTQYVYFEETDKIVTDTKALMCASEMFNELLVEKANLNQQYLVPYLNNKAYTDNLASAELRLFNHQQSLVRNQTFNEKVLSNKELYAEYTSESSPHVDKFKFTNALLSIGRIRTGAKDGIIDLMNTAQAKRTVELETLENIYFTKPEVNQLIDMGILDTIPFNYSVLKSILDKTGHVKVEKFTSVGTIDNNPYFTGNASVRGKLPNVERHLGSQVIDQNYDESLFTKNLIQNQKLDGRIVKSTDTITGKLTNSVILI